jgi:pimeloyl-ACP methyl ester carboxylesterase
MDLHHVRIGHGPPLLLLHPLGASNVVWKPVLDRLASEREVIAPDMPGFGRSPRLPDDREPTAQALAAAVGAFLDGLGLERAHLAGNSLGGWVALELAKRGRALSVTGLCTAGFWERPLGPRRRPDPQTVARLLLPLVPLLVRSARGRHVVLGGSVGHPARVPPADAIQLVRDYAGSPAFASANAAMRSALFSEMDRVGVPVTLVWAELDRLVTEPRLRVPGAHWVVLRGCGHVPTWDDPELVADVILEGSSVGARAGLA